MRGSNPDLELWRQEVDTFCREFTAELDALCNGAPTPPVSPRRSEPAPPAQSAEPVPQPQATVQASPGEADEAEARLQQLKRSLSEKLANASQSDA